MLGRKIIIHFEENYSRGTKEAMREAFGELRKEYAKVEVVKTEVIGYTKDSKYRATVTYRVIEHVEEE